MTEGNYTFTIREKIHGYLMDGGYFTCNQLHEAIGGKKDSIASELRKMFDAGTVMRLGDQKSSCPFSYSRVPMVGQ